MYYPTNFCPEGPWHYREIRNYSCKIWHCKVERPGAHLALDCYTTTLNKVNRQKKARSEKKNDCLMCMEGRS
jgi:MinD superfamily P-loop ATPase